MNADFRGAKVTLNGTPAEEELRVFKDHREIPQPGNTRIVPVQRCFAQHGIVRALVEADHYPIGLNFHLTARLDEPAVQLLRLDFLQTTQPRGQPTVTAVRQHGQGYVQVHVQADLARQAVQVEEVDADTQGVLDTIPPGIAGDQVSGADLDIRPFRK